MHAMIFVKVVIRLSLCIATIVTVYLLTELILCTYLFLVAFELDNKLVRKIMWSVRL